MNQIATHRASQITAPSLITREMDRTIGVYSNRLEEKPGDPRRRLISASLAPDGADRDALMARRRELVESLRPSSSAERADYILGIIAGFATYRMTDRELDLKVALYDEALRDEPAWIVDAARKRFGKPGWQCNWDGKDCPTSASVAAECRFIALPFEAELHRINLILDAELVDTETTEDERAKALAHWAHIRAGIVGSNVISERTEDQVNRERDAQQKANRLVRARERGDQATLADQLKAGGEPFVAYPREGEAA